MTKQEKPIQLYSLATPNGQKIAIALEEMGLPYEAHTVNILQGEQYNEEFLKISPNNKIPAIVDPEGPNGQEISLMETGAILQYLAEKTGQFIPQDPHDRWKCLEWLTFQIASMSPFLGQLGHFWKYCKEDIPYAKQRYLKETQRLFRVVEKRLEHYPYIAGNEYTIADMSLYPWINCVYAPGFYNLKETVGQFPHIEKYVERIEARESVKKGMDVCPIKQKIENDGNSVLFNNDGQ